MRQSYKLLPLAVLLLHIPLMAIRAQILSQVSDGESAVYLNYGERRSPFYAIGFATGDGDVMHTTDFEFPADSGIDRWTLRFGGRTSLVSEIPTAWDISPAVSVVIKNRNNDILHQTRVGLDFTALFGYYGAAWFAVGEFGYDQFVAYHTAVRLGVSWNQAEFVLRLGDANLGNDRKKDLPRQITVGVNYRY